MTGPIDVERIFLVGLSGAGKSITAERAAKFLGWLSTDSDSEIILREGRSIESIFNDDGEDVFRQTERQVIQEMSERPFQVVALGGGAFVDPTTRNSLLKIGLVVWLDVDPLEAARRLENSLTTEPRPLLGNNPAKRLQALQKFRMPSYKHAHCRIDTNGLTTDEVANAVVTAAKATQTTAHI